MPPHQFHKSLPASPFLIHPGGPLPSHSCRCREDPAVGLEGNILAKYDKELVISPSPVPQTVLLPLSQDGALSHRNRNKWLEAREREGRGKLLIRQWCWTLHTESMTSSPIFNYACSPPLRISLCLHGKKAFSLFCFCFEGKDIQPMGTLISMGL